MKKTILYLAIAVSSLIYACSPNKADQKISEKADSLINQSCYASAFEKDSAAIIVKTYASGKVKGSLLIKYDSKPQNNGLIEGKFSGDTLLVDYKFNTGKDSTRVYTNPLAFLKKDGKLFMGVGQIETTLGRSYFVKGKPINYERGKFVFTAVDCK